MNNMSDLKAPLVSIVVDGYNEGLSYESVDTLQGLRQQTFPLNEVELVFVGPAAQGHRWRDACRDLPFAAVTFVENAGAYYFHLKNLGGQAASGQIIVFTDSDVCPQPEWLASIVHGIRNGADVVGGVSLFHSKRGLPPSHSLMQVAAAITWGGEGFQAHNIGFRAETFRRHPYRVEVENRGGGLLQYREFLRSGVKAVYQLSQRVSHSFTLRWWLLHLNFRNGYETIILRRHAPAWPHKWVTKTLILEPVLTMLWRIALDVPQWFRFSRTIELRFGRRIMLLPLLVVMSVLARSFQMFGMYATLIAPQRMKSFAASH